MKKLSTMSTIAKIIVIPVGIVFIGFMFFGNIIFEKEKDWSGVILGLLVAATYGIRHLWRNYITTYSGWKSFWNRIDNILGRKFIEPVVLTFQSQSGIMLPDPEQPLVLVDFSDVDISRYDNAFKNLQKSINNFYFIGLAPICFLALIIMPLILIPELQSYHQMIGRIFLFLVFLGTLITIIIFHVITMLNDLLQYLHEFRFEIELSNELLSRKERIAAKQELESLVKDIQRQQSNLKELRADINRVKALSEAQKKSILNVMRATMEAAIQPQTESVKKELIGYHEKTGRAESKRSLIQDLVLNTFFLLAGLFIGQIPGIND